MTKFGTQGVFKCLTNELRGGYLVFLGQPLYGIIIPPWDAYSQFNLFVSI